MQKIIIPATLPFFPGTTTTMHAVDPRVRTTTVPQDSETTTTIDSDPNGITTTTTARAGTRISTVPEKKTTTTRNHPGMTTITFTLPPLAPWDPRVVPDHRGPRPSIFPSEHRIPSFPHSILSPHGETTIEPHPSFPPGAWPHNPRDPPYRTRTTTTSPEPSDDLPRYPVVPEHEFARPTGRPFGPSTTYSPEQVTVPPGTSPNYSIGPNMGPLYPSEPRHTTNLLPNRASFPPGFRPWNPLVLNPLFPSHPRPAPDDREWPTEPWPEHPEGPLAPSGPAFIPDRWRPTQQVPKEEQHSTNSTHSVSHHHNTATPSTYSFGVQVFLFYKARDRFIEFVHSFSAQVHSVKRI